MDQISQTVMTTVDEVNGLIAQGRAAGKLEAAQFILYLWEEPWPVTRMRFIDRLKAYIEELK